MTSVPVWDAAVRIFHWSLVGGVVTAWGQLKSGSAATGSRGRQRTRGHSVEELVAVLENDTHQFSDDLIAGHAKRRLAAFVSQGQHTIAQHFYPNGEVEGYAANGRNLLQTLCAACHGFEGQAPQARFFGGPRLLG